MVVAVTIKSGYALVQIKSVCIYIYDLKGEPKCWSH